MTQEKKIYLWLSFSELPIKKAQELLLLYPNINDLWNLKYTKEVAQILTGEEYQHLIQLNSSGELMKKLVILSKSNIKLTTPADNDFPDCFKGLDIPPLVIYYLGDLTLLKERNIAIIGSRICTRYGSEQTQKFAKALAEANYVITSGLAEGIDALAHQGTMQANGKAIGVLSGGLNYIYPAINANLAKEILEKGGVIISENNPNFSPVNISFVQRNRLIAAIADAVFVTEAGINSGTLHTVNYALDMGKRIFALPGNVTSDASIGSNNILKHFYGVCVTEPEDIIADLREDLRYTKPLNKEKILKKEGSLEEGIILNILKTEELHFDEIVAKSNFEAKKLLSLLTTMQIRGLIKKLPANYYSIEK